MTLKKDELSSEKDNYVPGTFGCHEVLHLTNVVAKTFSEEIVGHPAIQNIPEWKEKAYKIEELLYDLYSAIASQHLK